MDVYVEFGKRLATTRRNLNLSQKQLADKLDMPQSTYAQYETGKRKIPLEQIIALSNVLHTSPTVLVLGKEASTVDGFSNQEANLIKKYRQLDADGKEEIDDIINLKLAKLQRKAEADEANCG